ncbi:MAG: hypothetical protein NXH75_09510 [Halobacteriovoraceae bacterium]|nr:hypothetical protein [Halobacteriovoraceae bacterium]
MKFLLFLSLLFSFNTVHAQKVKIKLAVKKGNKEVTEALAKMNKTCGSSLKIESHHEKAQNLKLGNRTKHNIVGVAASVCASKISAIKYVCEKDKLYKEAVAAYKKIICTPDDTLKSAKFKMKVTMEKETIKISHHPTYLDSSSYRFFENNL